MYDALFVKSVELWPEDPLLWVNYFLSLLNDNKSGEFLNIFCNKAKIFISLSGRVIIHTFFWKLVKHLISF